MREQLEECQDETCPDQEPMMMEKEYRLPNQQVLREYEIKLRFLSRGMIISVGCKEIAFSDVKEGLEELNKYLANPYEEQKKWNKILNQ
jgi:hypothetical protein